MRILDLVRRAERGRVRVEARLVWEAVRRPDDRAFVEVGEADADALVMRGETFVLGALVPAMERGEARIEVEGPLCPLFVRNLPAAVRGLRGFHPPLSAPTVEATGGLVARAPAATPCVAAPFSGGVDAFATLRGNRRDLPLAHPRSIRVGVPILGMNGHDLPGGVEDPARRADFDGRVARWRPVAEAAGVRLVPVTASFRALAPSFGAWTRRSIGAVLAAIAHALSGRVTRLLVPSAGATDPFAPDGCHPLYDPWYGASDLDVADDGTTRSRLEKLALLADWPEALAVLQPCQQHALGTASPNCGRCNKCHRTVVALAALGLLPAARGFPAVTVDAGFAAGLVLANDFDVASHLEAADRFEAGGAAGLAAALRARVARHRRHRRWRAWRRVLTGRRRDGG